MLRGKTFNSSSRFLYPRGNGLRKEVPAGLRSPTLQVASGYTNQASFFPLYTFWLKSLLVGLLQETHLQRTVRKYPSFPKQHRRTELQTLAQPGLRQPLPQLGLQADSTAPSQLCAGPSWGMGPKGREAPGPHSSRSHSSVTGVTPTSPSRSLVGLSKPYPLFTGWQGSAEIYVEQTSIYCPQKES